MIHPGDFMTVYTISNINNYYLPALQQIPELYYYVAKQKINRDDEDKEKRADFFILSSRSHIATNL